MVGAADFRLCDEAMAIIHRRLSMPPPEHELWRGLTQNQRLVILMAAGLPEHRVDDRWSDFTLEEQVAMCDQIKAFGRIAKQLSAIRKGVGVD